MREVARQVVLRNTLMASLEDFNLFIKQCQLIKQCQRMTLGDFRFALEDKRITSGKLLSLVQTDVGKHAMFGLGEVELQCGLLRSLNGEFREQLLTKIFVASETEVDAIAKAKLVSSLLDLEELFNSQDSEMKELRRYLYWSLRTYAGSSKPSYDFAQLRSHIETNCDAMPLIKEKLGIALKSTSSVARKML